ncbi:hypothetical protein ACFSTC_61490 [Nonomuraea ferruginea]
MSVAAEAGLAASAWGLAAAMVPYLDLHCHLDTWQRTHDVALAAARAAGDTYGEAAMLRGLAQVALYRDRYEEAAEGFTRARGLFRELGGTCGRRPPRSAGWARSASSAASTPARSTSSSRRWPCSSRRATSTARRSPGRPSGGPASRLATWRRRRSRSARRCGWPRTSATRTVKAASACRWARCTGPCRSTGTPWRSSSRSATATAGRTRCRAWPGCRWTAASWPPPRPGWSGRCWSSASWATAAARPPPPSCSASCTAPLGRTGLALGYLEHASLLRRELPA